ncbi:protein O-mannosyl-transferase family [Rudanella lutea]|uniref:protein O-mannosyl-transferase family n=1 Tax=Rudanella lutea TaxID=451374 RepID=UPI0003659C74|nr:DUF2723 domain-containing protein [Rudanella lutea]
MVLLFNLIDGSLLVLHYVLFLLFIGYIGRLASGIARRSLSEWWLVSFLLFTGSVIPAGWILSALYLTGNATAWGVSVFITATILAYVLRVLIRSQDPNRPLRFSVRQLLADRWDLLTEWFRGLSTFPKVVFSAIFGTLAIIAVTNLLLVLFTVPNEWDSMTGHLNRVMQYIQRGTMRHFGGTNWNIDTYPKSVCTIQIYSFLITGRFENAFKLIHHLSYWTAIVAVFGIVQRLAQLRGQAPSLSASIFCAIAYALLPDFLMQAITTETDIVLTAYLSVLLYALFSYRATEGRASQGRATDGRASVAQVTEGVGERENRYLWLAAMAFALALGHKITFLLLLPSVFIIMIYTVFWAPSFGIFFGRVMRLGVAILVAVSIWTLPTGYLKNIQVFGHPIGPPTALKHQSVERAGSTKNLIVQGTRNVIRYGYDHINLDGIRNTDLGFKANQVMRMPLVYLEDKLNLRLDEVTDFSIQPFAFDRRFVFYNANPYWGVIGFALIFPLILLVGLSIVRSIPHLFLGAALLLHFIALSYSAPYDPFKGRYFIETGLFGVTFMSLLFLAPNIRVDVPGRLLGKAYVGGVVLLGCLSALLCVFLNIRALPFAWREFPSAFEADRVRVMTIGRPDIYVPYKRFDDMVPDTATVALGTINDDYEYPLYGPRLQRRLIPINPFERGVQPIPKEAGYLFFASSVIKPQPGDIRLGTDTTMTHNVVVPGEDYYLRKLK